MIPIIGILTTVLSVVIFESIKVSETNCVGILLPQLKSIAIQDEMSCILYILISYIRTNNGKGTEMRFGKIH